MMKNIILFDTRLSLKHDVIEYQMGLYNPNRNFSLSWSNLRWSGYSQVEFKNCVDIIGIQA